MKEAIQMVKPAKGTTTLAFIFKEGVMVAADSRASMGGYICECLLDLVLLSVHLAKAEFCVTCCELNDGCYGFVVVFVIEFCVLAVSSIAVCEENY